MKKKKDLQVLKWNMLTIQVCTNVKKKDDIERLTNEANLCGTTHGWMLDETESKKLGQAKVKCAGNPDRTHYILYA